jgi:hypothetical protein
MKKVTFILLLLLMIAAMLHISVAIHYCGGKDVASKISLSGKLANCGMEDSEKKLPLPGTNFTKHCCDDVVTFCGIDSNYVTSSTFLQDSYQYIFQIFAIPIGVTSNSVVGLNPLYTDVSPPGALMSTSVDLSDICVYRI